MADNARVSNAAAPARLGRLPALAAAVAFGAVACAGTGVEPVDLLITGGRVLDPETGLDAVRNVGIRDGRIVLLSEAVPEAADVLDVAGLVVAPGFIDLHAHGQDPESSRYQARDGVTTALELEIGVYPVAEWYGAREGRALLNYGASVSHQGARREAFGALVARADGDGTFSLADTADPDAFLYDAASEEELQREARLMSRGLDEGALGFGFGISYTPGASHEELWRLFAIAADRGAPVFVHLRSAEAFQAGGAIAPFQEVVANAATTGASVHIVHMNSSAGEAAPDVLALIRGARNRGLDVTTEAYPYTASASRIESALFDGWIGLPEEVYGRLQWVETGERLTADSFERYRQHGGWVITHGREEQTTEWVVSQPDVIVASDGIPFSGGRAHPRGAGTFARILGHYVRERGVLTLMDAVRKMTVLPAQRLEGIAPEMAAKGRVQEGADADLTLFDPAAVIDRATYAAPDRYSEGIVHVLVGGTFVVRDERLVDGVAPGRPIRGRGRLE